MRFKPFPFKGTFQQQVDTLFEWSNNASALAALLDAGHTDLHYQGRNTKIYNLGPCLDEMFQREDWRDIAMPYDVVHKQIQRMVEEARPASHFVNKETMMASLSAIFYASTNDIISWLHEDKPMGQQSYKLRLTVDMGAFVGTGLMPDGNERATTAVTMVLKRIPSHIEGSRIPFSVITLYPDIVEERGIGTIACTGRFFANEIADQINAMGVGHQMYWVLKGRGENVALSQNPNTGVSSVFVYSECNNNKYMVQYNNFSMGAGRVFVADRTSDDYVRIAQSFLPSKDIQAINRDINQKYQEVFKNAISPDAIAITPQSPLFEPLPEGVLIEGGHIDAASYENAL